MVDPLDGKYDPALQIKSMSHTNRPAIPGDNVTFQCSSDFVLAVSGLSVCMDDGHWEPDPRELECISRTLIHGEFVHMGTRSADYIGLIQLSP